MAELRTVLEAFLNDPAGVALKGAILVAFADFATGVFAAVKDKTFAWGAVGAFLRKHIVGRVLPLGFLLALGYFGGASGALFVPFAIAGLTAYATETASSIIGNFRPPADTVGAAAKKAAIANPVPTE